MLDKLAEALLVHEAVMLWLALEVFHGLGLVEFQLSAGRINVLWLYSRVI